MLVKGSTEALDWDMHKTSHANESIFFDRDPIGIASI